MGKPWWVAHQPAWLLVACRKYILWEVKLHLWDKQLYSPHQQAYMNIIYSNKHIQVPQVIIALWILQWRAMQNLQFYFLNCSVNGGTYYNFKTSMAKTAFEAPDNCWKTHLWRHQEDTCWWLRRTRPGIRTTCQSDWRHTCRYQSDMKFLLAGKLSRYYQNIRILAACIWWIHTCLCCAWNIEPIDQGHYA